MVVINGFEMVYVHQQQQDRFTRAGDPVYRAFEYRMEVPPIAQSRQRVLEREIAQAIDQSLQIGRSRFIGSLLNVLRVVLEQRAGILELQSLQTDR